MAAPPRPNQIPPDRLSNGVDQEEYFTLADDPDEIEIVDAPASSAFADMPGEREEELPPDEGFYENLAAKLDDRTRDSIATNLVRLIKIDQEARKRRDEQYEEGIRRTGMGKDAPGGAEFEGASRAVHPMITEACIDYQSRIMKELYPPAGPVKPSLIGAPTKQKTERAKRVADHMNYQITNQIKGARTTFEVLLAQVPLGGSQYIRQRWDHTLKRPDWQFAPVDKVLVPYAASDFESARRKTFIDTVDAVEFQSRIDSGMYLDLNLGAPAQLPERTRAQAASDKVEGVEDPGENLDGDRELYETTAWLEVTADMAAAFGHEKAGELAPYLVTIEVQTSKMLSMYRDWENGDEARESIEHMFEFPFIPWRGAYAIGLPQIIGGLSAAATGALRALLDSATVNTIPSGLILKGSGGGGQTRTPNPGELVEVDAGTEADDIRKRIMSMPFNPPSLVLFQLLGFLVDASGGVIRTSLDETPQNSGAPVPVGTQMSRVEEGLVVFSAIHGRAHAAFDRLLRGLHRLNRLYLPEEIKVDAGGKEIMVRRADYQGPCDVQPVSDPTIYSDQQRFTQLNYIQQRMLVMPQLYNAYEVELAGLKLMKWADPELILTKVPQPHEANAVTENLLMSLGQPVAVYADQDHLAHLQVLLDFMKDPALGMSPWIAPAFLPAAIKHAAQHMVYFYTTHVESTVTQVAGATPEQLASDDPKVRQDYDRLLAMASQKVLPEVSAAMAQVLPVLQAAMQQAQQFIPKPPLDPALAAVQAAAAETQRKTAADQAGHQIDTLKVQTDAAADARKDQIAAAGVVAKEKGDELASETKLSTTSQDNETALEISKERIENGVPSHFTNGQSMTRQ